MTYKIHRENMLSSKIHRKHLKNTQGLPVDFMKTMPVAKRGIFISGAKLAQERSKRLLSQEHLAEKSQVSIDTIGHLEPKDAARIFLRTALRLAGALGMTEAEFNEKIVIDPPASAMEIKISKALKAAAARKHPTQNRKKPSGSP